MRDRSWPVMATNMVEHAAVNAAMNNAMDEATGTFMDQSTIEHELCTKNGTGIVLVVSPTERTRRRPK